MLLKRFTVARGDFASRMILVVIFFEFLKLLFFGLLLLYLT